uniref:Uncharacterized protein n=1 Tax=Oryza sativa subsp. japonica TaxID=39947 RepID=Q5Z638_ORYSJ|nr:hypothetical protein [Oryza sativa Japonica Group]
MADMRVFGGDVRHRFCQLPAKPLREPDYTGFNISGRPTGHAMHDGDAGVARDGRVRYEEGGDEAHEGSSTRVAAAVAADDVDVDLGILGGGMNYIR